MQPVKTFFSWQRCHTEIRASAEEKPKLGEASLLARLSGRPACCRVRALLLCYSQRLASFSQDGCITWIKLGLPPPHQCTASWCHREEQSNRQPNCRAWITLLKHNIIEMIYRSSLRQKTSVLNLLLLLAPDCSLLLTSKSNTWT